MKQLILVFLGGGAGSVLRYLVSRSLNPSEGIPLGTLGVNVIGSLLIGLFLGIALKHQAFSPNSMLLMVTGFCGGFTTFSAFAYENQVFIRTGDYYSLALYLLASVVMGILAVFLGIYLSRHITLPWI